MAGGGDGARAPGAEMGAAHGAAELSDAAGGRTADRAVVRSLIASGARGGVGNGTDAVGAGAPGGWRDGHRIRAHRCPDRSCHRGRHVHTRGKPAGGVQLHLEPGDDGLGPAGAVEPREATHALAGFEQNFTEFHGWRTLVGRGTWPLPRGRRLPPLRLRLVAKNLPEAGGGAAGLQWLLLTFV